MNRRFLTALLVVAAKAAGALEPEEVLITYAMKRGGQQISVVSHELEWTFLMLDNQRAKMRVRVPIETLDSGDADFDSALRKAIGSTQHPLAQIEGIAKHGRLEGTLELAGVARPVTVHLHAERAPGGASAVASLAIDLRDYSIVLKGVDPHVEIAVIARFPVGANAVLAGGSTRPKN
jgi:polyisoprenoid-binding protein YceI